MKLFIDDERKTPPEYDARAWTVAEAIFHLELAQRVGEKLEVVSFDYDAHPRLSWTFKEIAYWMTKNDFWPAEIRIHTANYWEGRPWLVQYFEQKAPADITIDTYDPWEYYDRRDSAPNWVVPFLKTQGAY